MGSTPRWSKTSRVSATVSARGSSVPLCISANLWWCRGWLDDPRFLDRLNLFEYSLPFICVPIPGIDQEPIGVLAAQPCASDIEGLPVRTRFMEMVANLIAQTVRLVGQAHRESEALRSERDTLRRKVRNQYGFDNMVGQSPVMRQIFDSIRQGRQVGYHGTGARRERYR